MEKGRRRKKEGEEEEEVGKKVEKKWRNIGKS